MAPKALDAIPPVLALFRHGPLAVLRIHDLAFSGVVSAVVQSLPADVTSLMLVTPTDTKMFAVNAGGTHAGNNYRQATSVGRAAGTEDDGSAGMGDMDDSEAEDPQEEAIRLAEESTHDAAAAEVAEATAAVDLADTPAARRAAMNERRRAEAGPASDPCGRCGGAGAVPIAMPDGGSSTAACPVCRGSGVIRRYGNRR